MNRPDTPTLDVKRFDQAMADAVEAAQVGFYFEEGGCWGMAEALFEQLSDRGLNPCLAYRPSGFVHAWVTLGDLNLDWRGAFSAAPGALSLPDLQALRHVAHSLGGTYGEDYLSDVALAQSVVREALEAYDQTDVCTD